MNTKKSCILQRVFSESNNRQIKKLMKKHPELKQQRLFAMSKGKMHTKLLP